MRTRFERGLTVDADLSGALPCAGASIPRSCRGRCTSSNVIDASILDRFERRIAADPATRVFDLQYSANPWVWVIGIAGGAALVGTAGILAARSVVSQPPMRALRAET